MAQVLNSASPATPSAAKAKAKAMKPLADVMKDVMGRSYMAPSSSISTVQAPPRYGMPCKMPKWESLIDKTRPWGLYCIEYKEAVALRSVKVSASIQDMNAYVTLKQAYQNTMTDKALEVVYSLPMDEQAAVYEFNAEIDGRVLKGEVKEKEEAKQIYEKAVANKQTAALLEEKKADVFEARVGYLPPGKTCHISISYITQLPLDGPAVRFVVPTVVAPRYDNSPAASQASAAATTAASASAASSAAVASTSTASTATIPFSIECDICMPSDIKEVKCTTHTLTKNSIVAPRHAIVTLNRENQYLDKDFVLSVTQEAPYEVRAIMETDPEKEDSAVQVTFCPGDMPVAQLAEAKVEIIICIDRSGSMGGEKIAAVRNTLQVMSRSMPTNGRFNIVSFGSSYSTLFPESVPIDEKNLATVTQFAASVDADMGGTELDQPLSYIFSQRLIEGHPRQIFLLTDGEVSNPESVIQLARSNQDKARVFTFGIGADVSKHLVMGVARAGLGECEFVINIDEIAAKVMRQMSRALQPSISDIHIDTSKLCKSNLYQSPPTLLPMFAGSRYFIYLMGKIEDELAKNPYLTVTCKINNKKCEYKLPMEGAQHTFGNSIHRLAARQHIREWEEHPNASQLKDAVLWLALKFNLVSKHTSMVVVDEKQNTEGFAMVRQVIANATPTPSTSSSSYSPFSYVSSGCGCASGSSYSGSSYSGSSSYSSSYSMPPPPPPCGGAPCPPPSFALSFSAPPPPSFPTSSAIPMPPGMAMPRSLAPTTTCTPCAASISRPPPMPSLRMSGPPPSLPSVSLSAMRTSSPRSTALPCKAAAAAAPAPAILRSVSKKKKEEAKYEKEEEECDDSTGASIFDDAPPASCAVSSAPCAPCAPPAPEADEAPCPPPVAAEAPMAPSFDLFSASLAAPAPPQLQQQQQQRQQAQVMVPTYNVSFQEMVRMNNSDGSWAWVTSGPSALSLLPLAISATNKQVKMETIEAWLKQANEQKVGVTEDVLKVILATCVARAALRVKFASEEDQWTLMDGKAGNFLAKKAKGNKPLTDWLTAILADLDLPSL